MERGARGSASGGSGGGEGEATIRDGNVVVDEAINRREGLVEYVGDSAEGGAAGTATGKVKTPTADMPAAVAPSPAMQAGATVLGGLGTTPDEPAATTTTDSTPIRSGGAGESISMSTDSSASARSMGGEAGSGPMTRVTEGMSVVDANGEELGRIESVVMGDATAATTAGQEYAAEPDPDLVVGAPAGSASTTAGAGVVAGLGGIFGGGDGPDLAEPMRSQMLRAGYVKIDGKGWFGSDLYASADQVADVSNGVVRLNVAKEGLASA